MALICHIPINRDIPRKETIQNLSPVTDTTNGTTSGFSGSNMPFNSICKIDASNTTTKEVTYNPAFNKASRVSISFWYIAYSINDSTVNWKRVLVFKTKALFDGAESDFRLERSYGDRNYRWYNNGNATNDGGIGRDIILVPGKAYHITLNFDSITGEFEEWVYSLSDKTMDYQSGKSTVLKPCYFMDYLQILKDASVSLACYGDINVYNSWQSSFDIINSHKFLDLHYSFNFHNTDANTAYTQSSLLISDKATRHSRTTSHKLHIAYDSILQANCANFSGDDYIKTGTIECQNNLTLSLWLYLKEAKEQFVLDWRASSGEGLQPIYISVDGNIQYYNSVVGNGDYWNTQLKTNQWYFLTLVRGNSNVTLYINGQPCFYKADNNNYFLNGTNLYFGSRYSLDSATKLNGKIADFRLYNKTFTDEEVLKEYQNQANLTDKNQLVISSINESENCKLNRHGIFSSPNIVENQYYYTKDGAKFLKIFSHDVRNSAELFPADPHEVITSYITDSTNRFSRLKDISLCKSVDNFTQLPSGYTSLSYIYVSDTYINTFESATPNTKIRLDIQFDSAEPRQQRLWCAGNDLRFDSYINGNGYWAFAYQDDDGNWVATTKVADNMRHIFEMDGKNKTYKIWNALGAQECINMSLSSYTATKTSTPIYLFKDETSVSEGITTKARVFSCQIWQDGTLTKNFIPARNPSNVYGLFDTISQTFFTGEENVGTISGGVNNYYEFLLRYPEASEILYNRWRQTANPLATLSADGQTVKSMGYEPIEIAWSSAWKYGMGFRKANIPNSYYGPESYLDCQAGASSWYGGIGQNTLWNGGFPAPDGNAYKYVELYIRVDNTDYGNPASIRKEDLIPSKLKLPNLIQEYTYLELRSEATVDNGCYFDTGYIPNADTEIEIKFKINSMENGIFVFGAGGSAYDDAAFELYNWDNNWEFNYGTDGGATRVPATTDVCTFTFKDKVAKFSNSEITSTRTVTTLPTKSLYLFALNRTGGAVYGGSCRIYYCKIWEKGKLIKHYIPAIWQYSYPSGATYSSSGYNIGFYDVINNIYYSAQFSSGIPSSYGGWYNPFTGINASYVIDYENWEDGYQPVEYIESTGTQYINTGYAHDTKYTHYEFDFMLTNRPNTYHSLFGSRLTHNGNEAYYIGIHNDGHTYACIGGNKKDPLGFNLSNNTKYKIEVDPNRGIICDGTLYSQPCAAQTHFTAQNDYIFALNENGTPIEYMCGKLYRFKIWYNKDFLMRDFVPCYRKSDGAIGLYDRVYQRFYENDGTGTFIKGPDIANEHITTFMDEFKEI